MNISEKIKTARDIDKLSFDEKLSLKNEISKLYESMTVAEVAKELGLTKKTMTNVFIKLEISFRNKKETAQFMKTKYIKKYGVDNLMKLQSVKEKVSNTQRKNNNGKLAFNTDQQKKTMLEKYGVENPMHCEEIKQRLFETNIKRYGNKCSLQGSYIKEKAEKTNLKKYGAKNVLSKESSIRPNVGFDKRPETIEKALNTLTEKYGGIGLGSKEISQKIKKTCLKKYGYENPALPRMHGRSKHEDTIYNYISKKYPLLKIYRNIRSLMSINKRYEIDIYIPEKKVGFEIDGVFSHDEEAYYIDIENKTYKTKEHLKELYSQLEGITLYNLWESDIDSNFKKVTDIIDKALGD